jgi:hypothetical protein
MIWINITENDLRNSKASAVIDAFQTAALGTGQADPVPDAIASICEEIRTKIQSSGKNTISATANAIPPALKRMAMRLIAWEMISRINVSNAFPPSDQDKTDHTNDLRRLERIEKGDEVIEVPDDPIAVATVQRGGLIETAQEGNSGNSRDELSKL